MDRRIANLLDRVINEEDAAKKEDLERQTNELLGQHFKRNLGDLEELSYDITGMVWADVMSEDILPRVIDVKTVGLGETDALEEDLRGGRAYWQGKGGQIMSSEIRSERTFMPREEMVTALEMHADEIELNFWGSLAKFIKQLKEKIRQLPVSKLIELIHISLQNGSPFFGSFAVSSLTAAQVDSVVNPVAAKSGGQITIMGTEIAVRLLSEVGLEFSDELKTKVFNTGIIGVYKGYPVLQVENFESFEGRLQLPNDELWIVGRNAGRLTYYGDTPKTQQRLLENFWRRWEFARDAGMLLHGASKGRIGRIEFT
jgi:hypothetical protein